MSIPDFEEPLFGVREERVGHCDQANGAVGAAGGDGMSLQKVAEEEFESAGDDDVRGGRFVSCMGCGEIARRLAERDVDVVVSKL